MIPKVTFTSAIQRTGDKVPYNPRKIEIVLRKAFHSSLDSVSDTDISQLVRDIESNLLKKYEGKSSVHIEAIQDEIERILMQQEWYNTAKKFILYRQRHAEKRLAQAASKQQKSYSISVIKKDGTKVPFNINKILVTLRNVSSDIDTYQTPLDPIIIELEKNIFDGISSNEISEALILSTISFIERDPGYNVIATRLLHQKLYSEVFIKKTSPNNKTYLTEFSSIYKETFIAHIKKGVEKNYFTERLLEFDLEELAQALDPQRDNLLNYLGIRTLYERYFVRDKNTCLETLQAFWMRVAMGLSINETDKQGAAKKFYHLISHLRYVPSTPTLFHAGLSHPQLSSCYISTVGDDLSFIFKCIGDNAQMAKWSGGIGNDWTPVRATNSPIKSTKVESQGVIPFLKIANDTTLAINRSGKRRGATCAYLETWHLDIEDFLDLRRNTGDDRRRTHDMNTANWVPDLFMKRVEQDADWTLFSPNDTPDLHETYGADFEQRYLTYEQKTKSGEIANYKIVSALKLWRKMLTRLFETGHPWITFKDPCNVRSPQDHMGVIHSSNLCTEITLNNSAEETAVCNLGSINLAKHITEESINQYMLIDTIKTAMRMLDNVIDINFYPTTEAKASNLKHRPVGLGIMGLQDALYTLDLSFTEEKTLSFMDETMEFISYHAILASSELAKERGAYQSFKGSKWDRGILPLDTIALLEKERGQIVEVNKNHTMDWDTIRNHIAQYGMRNSNTMAIAPTATISNIAGCYPCIEPIYKNIYVKANMSGEFTIINEYLVRDLKKINLWSPKMLEKIKYYDGIIDYIEEIPERMKQIYKETFEIDSITLIKLTAIRAKWIDQSQSHNIFVKGASGKKLHTTYMQAWKMGLKTTYYLRSLGVTQIEKSTLNAKEYGFTQKRVYHTSLDEQQLNTPQNVPQDEHTHPSEEPITALHTSKEPVITEQSTTHTQSPIFTKEFHATVSESSLPKKELFSAGVSSAQETSATHTTTVSPSITTPKPEDFTLDNSSAATLVGDACNILDPDCEACQ